MNIILQVEIYREVKPEVLEYIFDCWSTFVTQDLGWEMTDALMVEVGEEMRAMRHAVTPNLPPN